MNLSVSAVSLVLNARAAAAQIPAATHARILAAAQAMGYRPNVLAQALRRRRAFTIGLLLPELVGAGPALAQAIADTLRAEGYDLLLATHHRRPGLIAARMRLMFERQVDGLILVEGARSAKHEGPVVKLSYTATTRRLLSPASIVEIDLTNSARAAIRHVVELGHRRLALLLGSLPLGPPWGRALCNAAHGLRVDLETRQINGGADVSSFECGYIAARGLLNEGARHTVLFTEDDSAGMGVLRALRESQLTVPGDVSVVGFGNHLAVAYNPSLTTVRIPSQEAGDRVARMIIRRIEEGAPAVRHRAEPLDAVFDVQKTTGIARA